MKRVSYMRILIGDNVVPYTYTDAQLEALIAVPQPASALPEFVKIAGISTFHKFPVGQ